jgi:hypothetical protein
VAAVIGAYYKAIPFWALQPRLPPLRCLLHLRLRSPHPDPHLHRMYFPPHPDSWNTYTITLVQPQLSYQNHQVACLLSDSSVIYDSTFTNELVTGNYQSAVAVGGEEGNYAISANIFATSSSVSIQACSLLVYFTVSLNVMPKSHRTCNHLQSFPCNSKTPALQHPTSSLCSNLE